MQLDRWDLVCLSHLRWDFVFQRPQHLLTRCARERRVLFVEEPVLGEDDARVTVTPRDGNVLVVTPYLPGGLTCEEMEQAQRALLRQVFAENQVDRYVLWYYTPMALGITRDLQPLATVYDCMDELSLFAAAPAALRDREEELFRRADLVFTGGPSLYQVKRDQHPQVYLFPSSVDVAHFSRARQHLTDPADQAALAHPRVGFYGVIDERMDLDLIAAVADARADWQIVLVGPVAKIAPEALPRRDNIHYLGPKSYDELPAYLANWDAAIMPFARNDATRFISPTKTPEYLAAGKAVVSTAIHDVVSPYGEHGLVHVADTPAAFARALEEALAEDAAPRIEKVDAFLDNMSWDRTWRRMGRLVDAVLAPKVASTSLDGPGRHGSDGRVDAHDGPDDIARDATVPVRRVPLEPFDYLIVGAGFAGSVLAERLATQAGKRVLIVDRRNHIGGNAYDHYDDDHILVHKYGPHIFHTNSADVFEYLSQFTQWRAYQHRVRACVDGQLVPIPINLDTINQLYGLNLTSFQVEEFFASRAETVKEIRTSEDVVVSKVGRELYEKFFRGYTRKQWGVDPSELDAAVTARVPTRTNRDDRYFTDRYQAMPLHGYTRMFERMLAHTNIKIMLNTDYREIVDVVPYREMVYTGPIDEFFECRFGKLPYRSLEFRFETVNVARYQDAPVVNYPNDYPYTRVTEFKYLTGQEHPRSALVYEYPRADGDPYYPVPRPENAALYQRYKDLADEAPGVRFVGRLATYKYYNMDQVVAQALAEFARITGARATSSAGRHAAPSLTGRA